MKSKSYILLIVNPIAGDSEKDHIIEGVDYEAAQRGYSLKIFETTGGDDVSQIQDILKEYHPERVLVAGGDGTISLVAQCLRNSNIVMGIIPAGSANGMAVNFEIPETVEEQIEVAFSDCLLKVDTLIINDKICLHIADLGMNAELVKNYESSNIRGKLGYFLQSIPTIINSGGPYDFSIQTENETFEKSGILLAIANANKFGTGANINPKGKINDGIFEILIFKNLDFIEILKTLQDNPEMSSEFVDIISTKKAIISTKKKVSFQIDGEFLGEVSEITAAVKPKSLLMAVPQEYCEMHNYTKDNQ
ncbi:diacylglycerol/lipid kinase family protein [Aequorivita echinoideorum]|uniref:YegS/Rv2252/BmrU family lipid kinase n=1 Tax=Aequorivita echinoideorum TaxID=1549647 RepID=A0ABS5S8W0_9FLAO|nr:YegS/Rv2252/BmrU family lipid kinase [Aequorivita echinoideorum]MBT0608865.1 YegS/Rv2252/BmrU family lipid kinase [Aequorivita echinoideorum]